MHVVVVRTMREADLAAVARLSGELGYPATLEAIERRFRRFETSRADCLLVTQAEGSVIGWLHLRLVEALTHETTGEILALVVEREARGRGIGEELLRSAESWARERGVPVLRVRSKIERNRAHHFYERLGYQRTKTQHTFEKESSR